MAGSLHGSARTTPRVRTALQASQETIGALAKRYELSRTTVTKWRARPTASVALMGPTVALSTVPSAVEETIIVEFRRHTLLPLVNVLGCLRTPPSTHSMELAPVSRAPRYLPLEESPEHASKRDKFADTAIGYVPPCFRVGKQLKARCWRTPFEAACQARTAATEIFKLNPRHLIPSPNV